MNPLTLLNALVWYIGLADEMQKAGQSALLALPKYAKCAMRGVAWAMVKSIIRKSFLIQAFPLTLQQRAIPLQLGAQFFLTGQEKLILAGK